MWTFVLGKKQREILLHIVAAYVLGVQDESFPYPFYTVKVHFSAVS